MNIKCGINGEDLTEPQILLCHHCGMPVCKQHGRIIVADDAFAAPPPEFPRTMPGAPAPGATAQQSAMHCRSCAEQFHRTAERRQRRADPAGTGRTADQFGQQAIQP